MVTSMKVEARSITIIIARKNNQQMEFLLLKRNSPFLDNQWLYIAGGIEERETAVEAVLRELKEETGLILRKLYSADKCEVFYFAKEDIIRVAPIFFGIVDYEARVVLNNEHSEYAWLPFEEALERLALPMQQEVLTHINKYFVHSAPPSFLEIEITDNNMAGINR
jgi:dATP pyrophosphohydrolase